jgi:MOSC domain-containing protein YiiM
MMTTSNENEMRLVSVNLGQERSIQGAKSSGKTGIYKLPANEPVQIGTLGLTGDTICDTTNHGGVDQAVYIYGAPDYAWWSETLGTELGPGTFGDNLTIAGLESARIQIGDRLTMGSVILEVTSPRIPCSTLAARMGDPQFVKRFKEAERPGVYCRVIQAGSVQAGDRVSYQRYAGETVTILEMFRDYYKKELDEATIRRYLAAPAHYKDRIEKEEMLKKMGLNP